jgi:hypothetical protein
MADSQLVMMKTSDIQPTVHKRRRSYRNKRPPHGTVIGGRDGPSIATALHRLITLGLPSANSSAFDKKRIRHFALNTESSDDGPHDDTSSVSTSEATQNDVGNTAIHNSSVPTTQRYQKSYDAAPRWNSDSCRMVKALSAELKNTRRSVFETAAQSRRERKAVQPHNRRDNRVEMPFFSCVAQNLKKRDPGYHCEGMQVAITTEMNKHAAAGTWDAVPIPMSETRKYLGAVHVRLACLRSVKHSESEADAVWKARVIALGDQCRTISGEAYHFADSSSAPSNFATMKAVMAHSLMAGVPASMSDAIAAYLQASLDDNEIIFAQIEPELFTESMKRAAEGIASPRWRLRRPIYGLPPSGAKWETFFERSALSLGWQKVDNNPQLFSKTVRNSSGGTSLMMMAVYVDDVLIGGGSKALQDAEWTLLRTKIQLTDPTSVERLLGVYVSTEQIASDKWKLSFSMKSYFENVLKKFKADPAFTSLGKAASPFKDVSAQEWSSPDASVDGCFKATAASHLMSLLYGARMVRADLVYTINQCSRFLTKWSRVNDRQLIHLMSYVAATVDMQQDNFVHADNGSGMELHVYADADLAGSSDSARSTSGGLLEMFSPGGTSVVLEFWSKRQTSTSHSTTEAECVAMSKAIREHGLPAQDLHETILGRSVKVNFYEDNESSITVMRKGYSSQLRHIPKTHRVSLSLIKEVFDEAGCNRHLLYIPTESQKADLFTKGLAPHKMSPACRMANLVV